MLFFFFSSRFSSFTRSLLHQYMLLLTRSLDCMSVFVYLSVPVSLSFSLFLSLCLSVCLSLPLHSFCICLFQSIIYCLILTQWDYSFLSCLVRRLPSLLHSLTLSVPLSVCLSLSLSPHLLSLSLTLSLSIPTSDLRSFILLFFFVFLCLCLIEAHPFSI